MLGILQHGPPPAVGFPDLQGMNCFGTWRLNPGAALEGRLHPVNERCASSGLIADPRTSIPP